MFQLKNGKEGFTVVEGPYKGRTFRPGESYAEIPPQEAGKFTEIKKAAAPPRKTGKPVAETEKETAVPAGSGKKGGK